MFVRCLKCRGVTWVEGDCRKNNAIDCNICSHPIQFRNVTTQDTRTRFEDAVCFAEASGIDLPSANSVLLGVMTLREALSIQGKSTPVPSGKPSTMEIAAGEAMRSLEQQRVRRAVIETVLIQPRIPEKHSPLALFAAAAMLLGSIALGAAGWHNWSKEVVAARALENRTTPKAPETNPFTEAAQQEPTVDPLHEIVRTSARLRRDRNSQVVQIIGRSPEAVLRTFCSKMGDPGQYEALELAATNPQRIGARVGVLRDYRDLSQSYAIWIQQRRSDRKWIAGSGKQPLKAFALDIDRRGETIVEISNDDPHKAG